MPMSMDPRQAMRDASFATVDQGMAGKADPQTVNLRQAEDPQRSCATCAQFRPPEQCAVVAGKTPAGATCDGWQSEQENPQENAAEGGFEE